MGTGWDPAVRVREAELMDADGLDPADHHAALAALARVNVVSGTSKRAWREVVSLWRAGRRPVRVLDVACGGGDVLRDLADRARLQGVSVELTGCDVSEVALAWARARAQGHSEGDPSCPRFERLDVCSGPLPAGQDLVVCSLFLHHLAEDRAVRLLASMAEASSGAVLVQDLRRTRRGYTLAWLGLHTLTRSRVARADGLTSVRAAFTLAEARALAGEARLDGAEVTPCWPQRFALRWERGGSPS